MIDGDEAVLVLVLAVRRARRLQCPSAALGGEGHRVASKHGWWRKRHTCHSANWWRLWWWWWWWRVEGWPVSYVCKAFSWVAQKGFDITLHTLSCTFFSLSSCVGSEGRYQGEKAWGCWGEWRGCWRISSSGVGRCDDRCGVRIALPC